ncbi:hypothetical protein [Actinomadura miaoliensis]|uniref:DUF4352 domain-containing protein n=1 Tax=Actinomadura miaoliensis TaxID=430685 RepID=A0ABP7W725_9ACTN
MRHTLILLAAAVVLPVTGCGSEDKASDGGAQTTPAQQTAPAAQESAAQPGVLKVGQTHTYSDGLKLTVTRLRLASKQELDPTAYDKPASWKGVLVDMTVVNGSAAKAQLDFAVTVTSDPNDSTAVLASYDGPGSVTGGSWMGDAPLLPGRSKKLTSGIVVASPSNITINFGSPYSAQEPRDEVTVVGDAR